MVGDLTKNFNRREFACKDECGLNLVCQALADTVQEIRDAVGKPVHIHSGTRCGENNKRWGGAKNSGHLTGEAADIYVAGKSNKELGAVIKRLYEAGRLPHLTYAYLIEGRAATNVHVGTDVKPRKTVIAY